ncbi:hypothetical protein GCM10011352_37090 [Marinobacterium zhoushanense]|uniref:Flagellar assembly protein FliH n=1 Tax=Marinobacterium zhoushanense TaxID=1679163 RepID=A0ABQ1KR58_9GAMM|nr:flagellar assembly protein FliH [Marinobacterium zhoushanense]GGC07362.1 hypothetical protein GCM10011352_37090 [Marinobacterium zhoushanense]
MKPESRKPIRIRASEVREVSTWQLPDMSETEHERLIALAQKRPAKPQPVVQVVEEEVYAEKLTLAQWQEICDAARAEGLEQGHVEGMELGRQEGHAQGVQLGLDEGRARIDEQVARLSGIIDQLQRPLEQQGAELETLLIRLVTQLSEAVVQAELRSRPEVLQTTISSALACIPPHAGTPVLALHPDDLPLVQPEAEQQGWELVADGSLTPGGCVLRAGACRVDASVETRFDQVAKQLLEHLLPATAEGGDDGAAS